MPEAYARYEAAKDAPDFCITHWDHLYMAEGYFVSEAV